MKRICTLLCIAILWGSLYGCQNADGGSSKRPESSSTATAVLNDFSEQMVKGGFTDFTEYLARETGIEFDDGSKGMSYVYTVNDQCEFVIWVGENDDARSLSVNFEEAIFGENKEEKDYLVDCIVNKYDPDYYDKIFKALGDHTTIPSTENRSYQAENKTYTYLALGTMILFMVK